MGNNGRDASFDIESLLIYGRAAARVVERSHSSVPSMSRRGNCYDIAVMESWFSTLRWELGETFEFIRLAKDQLFDYIEAFYNNRQRRHSSIGYMSPAQFERQTREPAMLMAA